MSGKFRCTSCQKEYRWKPELAGKKAKCKCGTTFMVPLELEEDPPVLAEDDGIYDMAEDAAAPAPPLPAGPTIPMAAVATVQAPTRVAAVAAPSLSYGVPRTLQRRDRCQHCGAVAPVKYVEFHQNVGALVMRFHSSVRGNLCKSCIHSKYWAMTGTTLAVGWLGTISIVLAPIFVINNTIRYVGCLGMASSYD